MKTSALAALVAAFLLPGFAQAAAFQPWNPPARFDHAYSGRITFVYGKSNYPLRCWNAYACTYSNYPAPGQCLMYMPWRDEVIVGIKFDLPSWNTLLRHERGHCNGWPGNHPS